MISTPEELKAGSFYLVLTKSKDSDPTIVYLHNADSRPTATSWSTENTEMYQATLTYQFETPLPRWLETCYVQEITKVQAQALIDLELCTGKINNLDKFLSTR